MGYAEVPMVVATMEDAAPVNPFARANAIRCRIRPAPSHMPEWLAQDILLREAI